MQYYLYFHVLNLNNLKIFQSIDLTIASKQLFLAFYKFVVHFEWRHPCQVQNNVHKFILSNSG